MGLLKQKEEPALDQDSFFHTRARYLVGEWAANYKYSNGLFFRVSDPFELTRETKLSQDGLHTVHGMHLDIDGEQRFSIIATPETIDAAYNQDIYMCCYHLSPDPIATGTEKMPDVLRKQFTTQVHDDERISIDPDRHGENIGRNGVPTYYQRLDVRTDGLDQYDSPFKVDPKKVNVREGGKGPRKLVPYDDNGNPILEKKDEGPSPPPPDEARAVGAVGGIIPNGERLDRLLNAQMQARALANYELYMAEQAAVGREEAETEDYPQELMVALGEEPMPAPEPQLRARNYVDPFLRDYPNLDPDPVPAMAPAEVHRLRGVIADNIINGRPGWQGTPFLIPHAQTLVGLEDDGSLILVNNPEAAARVERNLARFYIHDETVVAPDPFMQWWGLPGNPVEQLRAAPETEGLDDDLEWLDDMEYGDG